MTINKELLDNTLNLKDIASHPTFYLTPENPIGEIYTSLFSYDGLITDPKVIHNHDFMSDPRYVRSYKAASKALGHDHKMYWRFYIALWCAQYAAQLTGDFVECGVWRGFLTTGILNYLDWVNLDKNFYLFDTWNGLDDCLLSENEKKNTQKLEHLNSYFRGENFFTEEEKSKFGESCTDGFEFVKTHFSAYPRVQLIRGLVPDTLTTVPIEHVCYLSLDMNCSKPELAALNYFWDKMVTGGVILLDDYGLVSYEDQKKEMNAFAALHHTSVLALPTGQGLIFKTTT